LAKRRKTNISEMYQSQMPTQRLMPSSNNRVAATPQQFNLESKVQKEAVSRDKSERIHKLDVFRGIDHATSEVINSGFDDRVFGRLLNLCIEDTDSIESAMAFAAIVAKAKLARKHRHQKIIISPDK
jgi:hypothetical protein